GAVRSGSRSAKGKPDHHLQHGVWRTAVLHSGGAGFQLVAGLVLLAYGLSLLGFGSAGRSVCRFGGGLFLAVRRRLTTGPIPFQPPCPSCVAMSHL
ncbi:hypothetical protein N178_25415, partial [Priestia aryabhattai B8W22]